MSLKVHEVLCIPLLYLKGPTSCWYWLGLACPVALSHKAVLNALLSMRFYPCGYSIVYPSMLCGCILVYCLGGLKHYRLYAYLCV